MAKYVKTYKGKVPEDEVFTITILDKSKGLAQITNQWKDDWMTASSSHITKTKHILNNNVYQIEAPGWLLETDMTPAPLLYGEELLSKIRIKHLKKD